jgi:hypothetical protein
MTECNHCWHETNQMLMSDPPQTVDVCCWCGEELHVPLLRMRKAGVHGKYSPDTNMLIVEAEPAEGRVIPD